jgi:hypothetical protein
MNISQKVASQWPKCSKTSGHYDYYYYYAVQQVQNVYSTEIRQSNTNLVDLGPRILRIGILYTLSFHTFRLADHFKLSSRQLLGDC